MTSGNFALRERDDRGDLFDWRQGRRSLRVVLDMDSVLLPPSSPDARSMIALLHGLLDHTDIEVLRFSDTGAPVGAKILEVGPPGYPVSAPTGWLDVTERTDDGLSTHGVRYVTGNRIVECGIGGDLARGERATSDTVYSHLPAGEAATRRRADAVLQGAAHAAQADILICNRDFVLGHAWFGSLEPARCRPDQAVALIGQYLRSRGVFRGAPTTMASIGTNFDKSTFYSYAARSLLPASWRWFGECLAISALDGDSDLGLLSATLFQRLSRALAARDDLRWALARPQNLDTAEDVMRAFDEVMYLVVGAFDVTARVLHRCLGISGTQRNAGWTRDTWLSKVGAADARFDAITAAGSMPRDLVDLVAKLRNTVHSSALSPLGLKGIGNRTRTVIALPLEEGSDISRILTVHGWDSNWGLAELVPGQFTVDPEILVDHLLSEAFRVLNQILGVTPVALLDPNGEREVRDFWPDPSHDLHPEFSPHVFALVAQLGFAGLLDELLEEHRAALRADERIAP